MKDEEKIDLFAILALSVVFVVVGIVVYFNPANGETIKSVELYSISPYEKYYVSGGGEASDSYYIRTTLDNKQIDFECRECYFSFGKNDIVLRVCEDTIKSKQGKINTFLLLKCEHGRRVILPSPQE